MARNEDRLGGAKTELDDRPYQKDPQSAKLNHYVRLFPGDSVA